MKHLKMLGLAAVGAMALATFGAGNASADTLYKYTTPSANDTTATGTAVTASLDPGTTLSIRETGGFTIDTCTSSHLGWKVETNTGTHAGGKVSELIFGVLVKLCTHTMETLAGGELEIKPIAGTTNGTVISKNARVTIPSTIFGISCIAETGAGTTIGTLTGAKSSAGHATLDMNAVIPMPNCGSDATWTGSYTITSPTGLTVD